MIIKSVAKKTSVFYNAHLVYSIGLWNGIRTMQCTTYAMVQLFLYMWCVQGGIYNEK